MFKIYACLISGVLVIIIFTGLIILRRIYQIEFRNAEQQQQIQLSFIRNEEQHQEVLLPYNPPPDYDEVAQQTLTQDTRI